MYTSSDAKLCVAASGARDDYAIPLALEEGGLLDRLFTDFYSPDVLARAIPYFRKRHRVGLPSAKTRNYMLQTKALSMVRSMRGLSRFEQVKLADYMVGMAAARYAAKNGSGIVAYSWHWPGVVGDTKLAGRVTPKILAHVHATPIQIREILKRDREATGVLFAQEPEERLSTAEVQAYVDSLEWADLIVASSQFVRRGLEAAGFPARRISVIPLASAIPPVSDPFACVGTSDRKLRLLFVGQLVQRKGVHYLLNALRRFPQSAYSLTMVCPMAPDQELRKMVPDHVDFRSRRFSFEELAVLYRENDLFVMPSLVEAFGLVYAEALAQGLPIVCTENTGGADMITDGVEGFIVPAGDVEALAALFERCLGDLQSVRAMRAKAVARASAWTWESFRHKIRARIRKECAHTEAALTANVPPGDQQLHSKSFSR